MKQFSFFTLCAIVGLMIAGTAGVNAQKKMSHERVIWPADQLKWVEMPNAAGVMRATLWGNPDNGPSGVLIKFSAGTTFPLHYHTNSMKVVVISGTFVYMPEGGAENKLGPGSYLSYGPKDRHVSGTVKEGECVFFMEQPGKFDMVPIETEKK